IEWRTLRVDEVHRDLRLPIDLESKPLDVAQAAARSANGFGDVLRDLHVFLWPKVDVVGDEEGTRADRRGARGRMDLRWSEVGKAIRICSDLVAQSLELSATNVGEILAIGSRRRSFIEEDRNLKLLA